MSERKPTTEELESGYYLGPLWKGHQTYHCLFCPFDAMSPASVRRHLIERHQFQFISEQQVVTKKLDVPLYDASGQLLVEREVLHGES